MISGIYKITNKINDKVYIGCSKNIMSRWKYHKRATCQIIHKAIQLYGINSFMFEIILKCPEICFDYWEKYYIKQYQSFGINGYNMNEGGRTGFGYKHSEETKKIMSAANKGTKRIKRSEEHCKKLSEVQKGKTLSESTKSKIKEKRALQLFTEDTRKKMSESQIRRYSK